MFASNPMPPACSPPLLPFVLILLLPYSSLVRSENLQFNFSSFSPSDQPSFDIGTASAAIQGDALQLTSNTATNSASILNSTGRITYSKTLMLWDSNHNYTASFNTSFLLNMQPMIYDGVIDSNTTTGGGMAFILCSHKASESQVENSYGEWLGLFNGSIVSDSNSVYRFVAVELDTFKDDFDPDNNHVGIDLNGTLVSATNASLTPRGIQLRTNSTYTIVWVDYDGHGKQLNVFVSTESFASTGSVKPTEPALSYGIDLSRYLPQSIYLGFAGSTGTTRLETHTVLEWNFTSEGLPSSRPNPGLIVGLTLAVCVFVLALIVIIVTRCRRSRQPVSQAWLNLSYGPREFTYKELSKATNDFSSDSLLGEGGFGAVYKGTLADSNNSEVAVKRMSEKSRQGEREFIAEVTTIGRLRHRNLVQLLGWCQDRKGKQLLVYEYVPNGSLSEWIHKGGEQGQVAEGEELGWERRYNVMKGLAAGLLYLHEEWEKVVVHRDLKPSNVMLDRDYNARLGDFGMARLIDAGVQDAETMNIAGTPGYMAPEYLETGLVTKESDMYSFGAVAMEVASGCRPSFEHRRRVWQLHLENRLSEAADPRLAAFETAEMERLLLVGLACCHPDPLSRPTIAKALHALLSVSFPFVIVPPPPAFLFPGLGPGADFSSLDISLPSTSTLSEERGLSTVPLLQ